MVKSPKNCEDKIATIIAKKSLWIKEAKERMHTKKGVVHTLDNDTTIYFLGEGYPVDFEKSEKNSLRFIMQKGFRYSYKNDLDKTKFLEILDGFYLQKAQELLPKKIKEHAESMGLHPTKISFKKTKSQWGSCSKANALSINTGVMKLPWHLIEYIIIHELAHIKHKNHQKQFWALVAQYVPNAQELRREMKAYA